MVNKTSPDQEQKDNRNDARKPSDRLTILKRLLAESQKEDEEDYTRE